MKRAGKTTRPFRYDLNQIPYDYTVEVTNRFRGLDLIDKVPEELWTEVCDILQEAVIKTIPKKNICKKAKWLSEEALQIAEKRREMQRRKGEIYPFECRVPKNKDIILNTVVINFTAFNIATIILSGLPFIFQFCQLT